MAQTSTFKTFLDKHRPDLKAYEELYKHFHRNPELTTVERETASKITEHLRALSPELDIRTGIAGTGLIAILKNGDGPTVLLRADIDGLPIEEKTGLEYASTKTMLDEHLDQTIKPCMHACGHDFHITCALGATEVLVKTRDAWSGTIIMLFQPAEERGYGAKAMVDDGLYDPQNHACPIPDVLLAQHVVSRKPGTVATKIGTVFTAADSLRVTVFGKGGHGSMPHLCIDPVVIASHIVVRLQSIVSREVPPSEIAVVTVGSIKGGDTVNVISDRAVLQVNVRSTSEKYRQLMIDSIKRIVKAECLAGRSPKEPLIETLNAYPLTYNDHEATRKIQASFEKHYGERYEAMTQPVLFSEDFAHLTAAVQKPGVYWVWGGPDPEVWEKHEKEGTLDQLPSNHSPFFAPGIHPTLGTGIDSLVIGALTFLGVERE